MTFTETPGGPDLVVPGFTKDPGEPSFGAAKWGFGALGLAFVGAVGARFRRT